MQSKENPIETLKELKAQKLRWRQQYPHGQLPERFWRSAALLSKTLGTNPVCIALGLNYSALKKQVDKQQNGIKHPDISTLIKQDFVELVPLQQDILVASTQSTLQLYCGKHHRLELSWQKPSSQDWKNLLLGVLEAEQALLGTKP